MQTVRVDASKSYDVVIGAGLLKEAGKYIEPVKGKAKTGVIISDDTVYPLYGETLKAELEKIGLKVIEFVFPHGERQKNLTTFSEVLEFMCIEHVTRSDMIFALGGGVVGDLAGFTAATYQRGIRFVQVPTTLLAAVDSSVGGKTAVDLVNGKNQVGCFYQPELVLCDTKTLDTLPEDQFKCGCAEVIKYGVIRDAEFFDSILKTPIKDQIETVIKRCVEMKRDVVQEDEFDHGTRMLLNFGHTFGHAAEGCSDFSILHGEGVAMGMVCAAKSSVVEGICEEETLDAILAVLEKYGLPTEIPYNIDDMMKYALSDKKLSGDTVRIIVPEEIGKCKIETITKDELRKRMLNGGIK